MKKILLIEDEEIMIGLLQRKLTKEGYEISVAGDGEEIYLFDLNSWSKRTSSSSSPSLL